MNPAAKTTLSEVCSSVRYGYTASATDEPCGPKFLRITDIVPESIDWDKVPFCEISEDDLEKFGVEVDDIVVARTGATVGYAKQIRENVEAVFASYLVRFRVDPSKAVPRYIGKLVESLTYKEFVRSRIGGAAQPNASAPVLGSFAFHLPSRTSQTETARILSDYDDLIENNRRRMALLEESARLLYREWFVHLRFPGHEHTPIVDGVPQGWDRKSIEDFFDTSSGGTPNRTNPDFYTGEINWVKTQELNDDFIFETMEKITEDAVKKSSAKLFPANTVLVSMYGGTNIGRTGILAVPSTTNQACCALLPLDERAHFIFTALYFREHREKLISLGQGAAQTNISQQVIRALPITLPSRGLMASFVEALLPVFEQVKILQLQNKKLRAARDLLLPRLMSGEIAI